MMTQDPQLSAAAESTSDRSLLRRFQGGDDDAATALYQRYARRLEALARKQTGAELASRFDADDVVQSVFRTFFRRAAAGLYEVPPGDELWRLLLVLALHKVRDFAVHHRAQKRDVTRTWGVTPQQADLAASDQVGYDALRMVIDELIVTLPEANRQIIELRIEGHEVKEIAERTGRSNRTVERTLQNFRTALRGLIDGGAGEP
jgi:RNA polymerase sigma-70 factor, ECF subfamily